MKIHIDTSTAEEQAKAQAKKQQGASSSSQGKGKTTGKKGSTSSSSTSSTPAAPTPKKVTPKPLPKLKKETKPPADVASARKRQTSVLKEKQHREVQGKFKEPARDVDAGSGFGFQTYPFL